MDDVHVVVAHCERVTLRVGDVFLEVDGDPARLDAEAEAVRTLHDAPDLATLTLGHEDRLADVLAGYGHAADTAAIRAWWSLRGLLNVRWLAAHGFDPFAPGCEVDVLKARM
ncbi:hypothetical protein GCM10010435_26050 [Winogradskya consettensis]|uniref:Uncharacterized protein n=1 Tax=Winogradskya consettensis TaxID=113560 RepID=A0A919SAJ5_9ACTN|nr:hypothetical protein [Actinoplanes consettensis]GIM68009.1 hypothetical protein Aco04nite_08840 [Actinoplanes consettensis]